MASGVLGLIERRASARLTSSSQPSAHLSTFARHPARPTGWLAGDGSASEGGRQEELWRQFFRDPTLWWDNRHHRNGLVADFQHRQSQEVLWLNNVYKPAWVDAQLGTLDMGLGRRAAGDHSVVTAEAVRGLCHEGHLRQAVEALELFGRDRPSYFQTSLLRCFEGMPEGFQSESPSACLCGENGYQSDRFLCNHVMRMYASHGRLEEAMDVFETVAQPNAFMWCFIISVHAKHGQDKEAIQLYHRMRRSSVKPDGHVFVAALQACAKGKDLKSGQQVHADIWATDVAPHLFVYNCLVNMYVKCGSLEDAQKFFHGLAQKDVVTWTSMIAGYSQQGMGQEALRLYRATVVDGMAVPNSVTFACLLRACAAVGTMALAEGKQLHMQIKERGHQADVFVANSLVNMYAKCGSLEDAQRVFDTLDKKDLVTWNSMMAGYSQQGAGQEALRLYSAMQEEGLAVPDSVTFVCLLQACASVGTQALEKGKQLHARIKEEGHEGDLSIANSLLNMYSKCGSFQDAQRLFDALDQKDVVTWNAMIAGYSQQGMGLEALSLYSAMVEEGMAKPDSVTFVCLLQACASVGTTMLETGKQLHAQIQAQGHQADMFVANSLVNMYAKCGSLKDAQRVFDRLDQKNVVTWNAMIAGYSQQGMGQEALCLYNTMQQEGMAVPDSVTFVCLLQACTSVGTSAFEDGKQLHMQILERGHQVDLFVANSLVNMYLNCGNLEEAQRVFNDLDVKDLVTWNLMIAGYSQQGMGQEALYLYSNMIEEGMVVPDSVTFVWLLQACATVGTLSLEKGSQLHMKMRELGYQADILVGNSLVNMYAKCGSLEDARSVFDGLGEKDVVTWNAMIAGYSQQGMGKDALCLYRTMQAGGIVVPDSVTFVSLLQACASLGTQALEKGKQLHVEILKRGHEADLFVASSLVSMYAMCGSLEEARRVFDTLGEKNVVTWNAMIAGYSQQGMGQEALHLYRAMQEEGNAVPDSVTFVCLLQACASLGTMALEKGKQVHMEIKERGYEADVFVSSSLVNMYAKCGTMEDAQTLFEGLGQKDLGTWNAMIAGHSYQGLGQDAFLLYSTMQERGMAPDSVTFICLLQACATVGTLALEKGKQLHAQIKERGCQPDLLVANSLVNMYAKCGSLEDAQRVFDKLGEKNVVTWNSMISGYSQVGMGQEALRLYSAMLEEGMAVPDSVTFVFLLQACANVAALDLGRQLHAKILEQGLETDVFVAGSLINMYGKCGSTFDAQHVFDVLPERDVVIWNGLIAGYTCQGDSSAVFHLVQRMSGDGLFPDGITFLSVLTVCTHAGLVSTGWEYFDAMSRHYGITPTENHYTCMVDLLSRAGQLDEALGFVRTMPVLPNAAVWHTLLGACRKWSNVEVGCCSFNEAVKLDKNDAAAYQLMSNIYTGAQMWEQAQKMQERRTSIRAWKQPGQSWWTDKDGLVHSFLVGDENLMHPQSQTRLRP